MPKAQGGISLLESLIALLVLSFGLLGVLGLQTQSLVHNRAAYFETQATNMAQDMLDRVRANREQASSYTLGLGNTPGGVVFPAVIKHSGSKTWRRRCPAAKAALKLPIGASASRYAGTTPPPPMTFGKSNWYRSSSVSHVSPSQAQAGFTLVELLVAMVIGLLVMAGATQLFISSQQSFRFQTALADMQDTGRFALDTLSRELRQADYSGGCALPQTTVHVRNIADTSSAPCLYRHGGCLQRRFFRQFE